MKVFNNHLADFSFNSYHFLREEENMFANNFVQFWFSQKAKHCCRHEKKIKSHRRSNSYIILGFPAGKSSQVFFCKLDYSRRRRAFTVIEYEKNFLAEHYIYVQYTIAILHYIYTPVHLYSRTFILHLHNIFTTCILQYIYTPVVLHYSYVLYIRVHQ